MYSIKKGTKRIALFCVVAFVCVLISLKIAMWVPSEKEWILITTGMIIVWVSDILEGIFDLTED